MQIYLKSIFKKFHLQSVIGEVKQRTICKQQPAVPMDNKLYKNTAPRFYLYHDFKAFSSVDTK